MAANQLDVKGQEVSLIIVSNGVAQASISDFMSCEFNFMFDLLTRSYLGQTADRYDEIYKGFKVSLELNFSNEEIFAFIQTILDRASRRNTNLQINIQAVLNMPNGDRPKLYGSDLFFAAIPVAFANRAAYGSVKLDATGSSARIKLS